MLVRVLSNGVVAVHGRYCDGTSDGTVYDVSEGIGQDGWRWRRL